MRLEKQSPCKVNLLLNILGKRPDGYHELETLMHPVPLCDQLAFERTTSGIFMTCTHPKLPVDAKNLVWRAAAAFLDKARIADGVRIHLDKQIPLAAGLGGGSGNAAVTLLGLNELFGTPLDPDQLWRIAKSLGSDVPFFLQSKPALATGRGENIQPLNDFPAFENVWILLAHPGFGVPTPWAYQQLAHFPGSLNGHPGRTQKMITLLQTGAFESAVGEFYNSFEAPVLRKYPLLAIFQQFFRENGAATLMSGSGSTTFALVRGAEKATSLLEQFKARFGDKIWISAMPLHPHHHNKVNALA